MRMRKLKWAKDYLDASPLVVKNMEEMKGKWRETVHRDCLHVEIGTGKGDYWIQMSKIDEESGWIGIEKNESVAGLAVRKATESEPGENMKFIYGDADAIDTWFEEKEIDVIHLNFSDPWPKKRASKRRLSHKNFLEKYKFILKDDGEIRMKTDNSSLFEFSLLQFEEAGWKLVDVSVDFRRVTHDEDAISEYERKFMEKGQPIYRAVWKK